MVLPEAQNATINLQTKGLRRDMLVLNITTVTGLGILLLGGYLAGQAARSCKFPRVTGYIVAGMLLSPSLTGILGGSQTLERYAIVADLTLAVIAFAIGGSLKFAKLKQLGKGILVINFSEALAAFIATFGLLLVFGPLLTKAASPQDFFYVALLVGALSAATAPAAVLAIVHECRASGPLTTTLLGVVALDDAMAIVLFAFASSLAAASGIPLSLGRMLAEPGVMILLSLAWGSLCGYLLTSLTLVLKSQRSLLVVVLGGLLLCSGLAVQWSLSPLLSTMVVGVWAANRGRDGEGQFQALETVEEPLFALFFTLAGAHFDWQVFTLAGPLALLIVLARFGGKLTGAYFGARMAGASSLVRRYLGCGLLPQAGVTVGLVLMGRTRFDPQIYQLMLNAVLGSVIINELLAPPLVRYALLRSGEGLEE
jgi:Kef-type K+ transport system membrane component KefB